MTKRVEFGVRAPVAGPLASVEAVNRIAHGAFVITSGAAIVWITILTSPLGSRCNRQAERQEGAREKG